MSEMTKSRFQEVLLPKRAHQVRCGSLDLLFWVKTLEQPIGDFIYYIIYLRTKKTVFPTKLSSILFFGGLAFFKDLIIKEKPIFTNRQSLVKMELSSQLPWCESFLLGDPSARTVTSWSVFFMGFSAEIHNETWLKQLYELLKLSHFFLGSINFACFITAFFLPCFLIFEI